MIITLAYRHQLVFWGFHKRSWHIPTPNRPAGTFVLFTRYSPGQHVEYLIACRNYPERIRGLLNV
jgi:hypothetical protein